MHDGYRPELYDLVTPASFRGDAEWYSHKAVICGGPVLELGAGTGRITLPIARAGVQVYALDADPAMLDRLRHKLADEPAEVRERVTVMRRRREARTGRRHGARTGEGRTTTGDGRRGEQAWRCGGLRPPPDGREIRKTNSRSFVGLLVFRISRPSAARSAAPPCIGLSPLLPFSCSVDFGPHR
jgi:SAM-dependent methyltransferase